MAPDDGSDRAVSAVTKDAASSQRKPLSPAAERALKEAASHRAAREGPTSERPNETPGRGGLDPTRYGDWEVKGIATDF